MAFDAGNDIVSFNLNIGDIDFSQWLPEDVIKQCLEDLLVYVGELIQENFSKRQDGWKPLAPSTIRDRKRLGYGPAPILVRSQTLLKNVAAGHDMDVSNGLARGSVFPIPATPPYGKVSIEEYAEALNAIRPFYDLDDSQMQKAYDYFVKRLSEELGLV